MGPVQRRPPSYAVGVLFTVAAYVSCQWGTGPTLGSPAWAAQSEPSDAPQWIHCLGWARDNRFVAWRQGTRTSQNRPGTPFWLARAMPDGQLQAPKRCAGAVKGILRSHNIHGRIWVWRDQVAPMDVLMRTRQGKNLVVVVRGWPPTLAVLRKWRGEYELVARRRIPGPVTALESQAFESPDGSMIAIVANTTAAGRTLASMFALPLNGPPPRFAAAPLPGPASRTKAAAPTVPLSQPTTPIRRP